MLQGNKDAKSMSSIDSILIGAVGGLSVFGGISRIGCTSSVAVARGADRQQAIKWSLLLSVFALASLCCLDLYQLFFYNSETISFYGDYCEKYMIPQLKELIEEYDIDGAWIDGDAWAVKRDYSPKAAPYFTDDMDDDFSQTFMRKTTMKIIEINEDSKIATVEFCVPDIEKIMLSELPTDETDDYDTLFSTYCSNINEAIANADEADMITQTIECPVITDDSGSKISIEGAPLLNYQNILADILIDIINESKVE
jgi:hypothetical protein